MLENNLNLIIRNFKKKKAINLLIILCLTIGITCFLIVMNYAIFEFSYDRFHKNFKNIYRAYGTSDKNAVRQGSIAVMPYPFGPALKKAYPEVLAVTTIRGPGASSGHNEIKHNGVKFTNLRIGFTDSSFFKIFSFKMIAGDRNTALKDIYSVVISKEAAQKYFGNDNPLNKILTVKNKHQIYSCKITGVFDKPKNSDVINWDIFISLDTYFKVYNENRNNWALHVYHTYLLLKKGIDPEKFQESYQSYIRKLSTFKVPGVVFVYALQPLKDRHFHSAHMSYNGIRRKVNINIVYFLIFISVVIISCTWLNYININSTSITDRAKEVAMKKIFGSQRIRLFMQFFIESLFLNGIAVVLSLMIIPFSLPVFNQFTRLNISFNLFNYIGGGILVTAFFLGGILVSSIIPAIIYSSLNPTFILSGKGSFSHSKKGNVFRKTLGIMQLSITSICIICTLAVFLQINYMKKQDLGFNMDNLLILKEPVVHRDNTYHVRVNRLTESLRAMANIENVSISHDVPGRGIRWSDFFSIEGQDLKVGLHNSWVGYNFINTFKIKLIAGRNFSRDYPTDYNSAILSMAALKELNVTDISGILQKKLIMYKRKLNIIGIIDDYQARSLKKSALPIVFLLNTYRPEEEGKIRTGFKPSFISIKLREVNDMKLTLKEIENIWKSIFPSSPMDYFFLDDFIDEQYSTDRNLGKMFGFFSIIVIIITCFGVFSISYFDIARRTKEIGIRKVLGGSTKSIFFEISKQTLKVITVATCISWMVSYFIINNWLNNYAYRMSIPWGAFLLTSMFILTIIFITISHHLLTAVRKNPVNTLKYE